jgi:rhodanese-related sulfurtransferase
VPAVRGLDFLRELRQAGEQARREAEDARALQALAALPGPFLPWTSWSMRPAAILAVVTDVGIHDRRAVVECGSGNSTVFTARLLAQRGAEAHVHSLEHEAGWAQRTREALAREDLEPWATVTHAPLRDGWYARGAIPEIERVDLLVVDGPPGWDPVAEREIPGAREPALDEFATRLAPGATVILDDSGRTGEQRVLAAWEARHGLRFRAEPGGYAVAGVPA